MTPDKYRNLCIDYLKRIKQDWFKNTEMQDHYIGQSEIFDTPVKSPKSNKNNRKYATMAEKVLQPNHIVVWKVEKWPDKSKNGIWTIKPEAWGDFQNTFGKNAHPRDMLCGKCKYSGIKCTHPKMNGIEIKEPAISCLCRAKCFEKNN